MFSTHKLNDAGFKAMEQFKTEMSVAVSKAAAQIPNGREKALFLTKVEEAVFFGAKAIAGQPENHTEVVNYPEAT